MHVFEKIDAQLELFTRRHIIPAGIFLTPADLQELVEDVDAGMADVDPDGKYHRLTVHEVQADKSYISTEAGGRVFLDYTINWAA